MSAMNPGTGEPFWRRSLRAHLWAFQRPPSALLDGQGQRRLLLAFALVALGLFGLGRSIPQFATAAQLPLARSSFVLLLLLGFVLFHRHRVRLPWPLIGLPRWRDFGDAQRLFALQVIPLAALAFAWVFRSHLGALLQTHGLTGFVVHSLLTGLLWGIVQELLYRGWLQTALVARLGVPVGLLLANLIFTFGPLHWNLLAAAGGPQWGTLAAVFAIGLLFGALYQRSGNLWLPAILHGLWPLNMQ